MGVVKRTHMQSRLNQLMMKNLRKHPEIVLDFLNEFIEAIPSVMEALTSFIERLSENAAFLSEMLQQKLNEMSPEEKLEMLYRFGNSINSDNENSDEER